MRSVWDPDPKEALMSADDASVQGRTTCLLLQGGGALGAYQAGAFEVLSGHVGHYDWLAGISIGSVNAAIIAGNAPEVRVDRLKTFWNTISSGVTFSPPMGDVFDEAFLTASAAHTIFAGAPGFFKPRFPPPFLQLDGRPEALSFYDTKDLVRTLERLVDFDRINHGRGRIRLSVGAVNVRTGNFAYFDSAKMRIGPEHILASGALPPGLPPVEIDGESYWDGGLVSNTPLQYVLETAGPDEDLLVFQVDLFSARGPMPANLGEAAGRVKDIQYSSRTRLITDMMRERQAVQKALARLLSRLPAEMADDRDVRLLRRHASTRDLTLVHLIYRGSEIENYAKDFEFSRFSVDRHWRAGMRDAEAALARPEWRLQGRDEVRIFDPGNPDPAAKVQHGENLGAHASDV
jgi:NTE family protein